VHWALLWKTSYEDPSCNCGMATRLQQTGHERPTYHMNLRQLISIDPKIDVCLRGKIVWDKWSSVYATQFNKASQWRNRGGPNWKVDTVELLDRFNNSRVVTHNGGSFDEIILHGEIFWQWTIFAESNEWRTRSVWNIVICQTRLLIFAKCSPKQWTD
jgi:hypothetical protein